MAQFFGHFHPLLVHLPIGILLMAFVLECLARFGGQSQLRPAIRWSVGLGLASAVLSSGTGWLLSRDGGYDAAIVVPHQYWGFGTVVLFGWLWFADQRQWYFPLFVSGVMALVVTGHYGGDLTHGEGYLFENQGVEKMETAAATVAITDETPVFQGIIQPILKEKCTSCHRPGKRKGDLDLTTEADILKGGKNGKIIFPGMPDSSKIMQRICLPLDNEDHMPPARKPQLTALEQQLLAWWIKEGADFQGLVKSHPVPEDLLKQLNAAVSVPANPVFLQKIAPAPIADIEKLKALGFSVQRLGEDSPWLAVSAAGQQRLTSEQWRALTALKTQVADLDLSHTGITDKDVAALDFPNLVHLNLGHTQVGDGALEMIQRATHIASLNLTNTAMGPAVLNVLPKLGDLNRLFLWQTKISDPEIESLRKAYPRVKVETGAIVDGDAQMALRAPKMLYARSFFDDTVQVELNFPFKGVDIFYTIAEEASPTTQSPKYTDKIILDKTSHVRAFAAKPGWLNSPLIDAVFVQKKIGIAAATLLKPPSPKYPAKGAASLIDGKIADAQGADTWLGYEGEHLEAVLDLGQVRDISKVFVHCLENNAPWIHRPVGIIASTSLDGKKFTQQASAHFPPNTSMGELKTHLLGCHFSKATQARYVRVKVESMLKNPDWHPGKGLKCWIFVDEVVVE